MAAKTNDGLLSLKRLSKFVKSHDFLSRDVPLNHLAPFHPTLVHEINGQAETCLIKVHFLLQTNTDYKQDKLKSNKKRCSVMHNMYGRLAYKDTFTQVNY